MGIWLFNRLQRASESTHHSASSSQMVSGNIPSLESHLVVYGQSFAGFHKIDHFHLYWRLRVIWGRLSNPWTHWGSGKGFISNRKRKKIAMPSPWMHWPYGPRCICAARHMNRTFEQIQETRCDPVSLSQCGARKSDSESRAKLALTKGHVQYINSASWLCHKDCHWR